VPSCAHIPIKELCDDAHEVLLQAWRGAQLQACRLVLEVGSVFGRAHTFMSILRICVRVTGRTRWQAVIELNESAWRDGVRDTDTHKQ